MPIVDRVAVIQRGRYRHCGCYTEVSVIYTVVVIQNVICSWVGDVPCGNAWVKYVQHDKTWVGDIQNIIAGW